MNSELVIAALGKHLDALGSLVSWVIGLALISAWAGLQRSSEISILSMKVTRKDAFYLLGATFLCVNIAAIVYFMRIAELLLLVKAPSFPAALTVIGTHAWPFNPYAYFGASVPSSVVSNFGYGALIVIWWIAYTALALVQDNKKAPEFLLIVGVFLVIGLASMGAIQYGFVVILGRLHELDATLEESILSQIIPRKILTFVGIGVGAAIFWFAQKMQVLIRP